MDFKLSLALFAGIVIGVTGLELVRASESPPGYLIVEYEITDPVVWKEYLAGSNGIASDRTFLVRHAKGISLSGEPTKWIGVIQYPSVADALAHDSSKEYSAIKPLRDSSTNWRSYLLEGLPISN